MDCMYLFWEAAFIFQDLHAPQSPQFWKRLAGAVGLHKDTNDKNLKTQKRNFQDEGDRSPGIRIKGEVTGGGIDKPEKERDSKKIKMSLLG